MRGGSLGLTLSVGGGLSSPAPRFSEKGAACRVHSEVRDAGMDGWMESESGRGSKEEPHATNVLRQQWVGYQKGASG